MNEMKMPEAELHLLCIWLRATTRPGYYRQLNLTLPSWVTAQTHVRRMGLERQQCQQFRSLWTIIIRPHEGSPTWSRCDNLTALQLTSE